MAIGVTLLVVAGLIIAIYVLVEIKRLRHKIFAIFLIALILFTYVSFTVVLKDREIDFKTITGLTTASKLYFSWMSNVFVNAKTITGNAIKMDWSSVDEIDSDKDES